MEQKLTKFSDLDRSGGILLHPTSLPSPYGIGDLGKEAYNWIDFLVRSECRLWQVLPLGPTGYADSPYQCFSAFAGNPNLISPKLLVDDGLLDVSDLEDIPDFPDDSVDYGSVISWKTKLLEKAYYQFDATHPEQLLSEFNQFQQEQAHWLSDFAMFMALKRVHCSKSWVEWSQEFRDRTPKALEDYRKADAHAIRAQAFHQFIFYKQWRNLRAYARDRGVWILGDIPIFVAHDSADVWALRDLFYLDNLGHPTVVAGVPPDYFSPTGQLWGNPLYRWEVHRDSNFAWWVNRFQGILERVDLIRLDHFRGYVKYWEVPAEEQTAVNGRWVQGPGGELFDALSDAMGELPLLAEDLGEITPDVIELRDRLELPGMKILQFAFDSGPENPFLPRNYDSNCVVYTGTHDNDTTVGWYRSRTKDERERCLEYIGSEGDDIAWELIQAAWESVARFALTPMQDVLGMDSDARMNFPSVPSGNWQWRMTKGVLNEELVERMVRLNRSNGRSIPPESSVD